MTDLPLLTSSRLRCFRTCPRLHQLTYVERFRTIAEPEYFRVGTLVHAGLEAWWSAEAAGLPRLEAALAVVAGLAFDEFEQARVEEMLRGYEAAWGESAADYEVLAVERTFKTRLWNPNTGADSRTWRLAGKIDAIVRRRADGRVIVVEHKTTGEDIRDEAAHYWSTLALDHQCSAYIIGAESLGWTADEVLYDVLRKPGQQQLKATPEASRKFTKDGRLYSGQREADETPDEYRARVREAIEGDLPRYFARQSVPRMASQVRDFLLDAWHQGRAMREMERDGFAPRNPDACHRFGTCVMWGVCSTGSHPSAQPDRFHQVDDASPELAGGATT